MKDNTNLKKSTARPADPVIVRGPNAGNGEIIDLPKAVVERAVEKSAPDDSPQQLKLTAFPDGSVFKYAPHPDEPTFAIFGADGKPVAFVENPAIARLFCDAVRMVFAAAEEFRKQTPPTNQTVGADEATRASGATRIGETEDLQDPTPGNTKGI